MRWERRKPLWPIWAALGLLLILALAAPRAWQGVSTRRVEESAQAQRVELSLPAQTEESKVQLPVAPRASLHSLTESPAALELPSRSEFNIDKLIAIRDSLLSLFDQVPPSQPTFASPDLALTKVRVRSENDRLAMVPPRVTLDTKPSTPTLSTEISDEEVADFAAILLEAARNPKPAGLAPGLGLQRERRIAMRPTPARPADISVPTKPVPTQPQSTAPQHIEAESIEVLPAPAQPPLLRHRPEALIEQLEGFSVGSRGALWSQQVLSRLRLLLNERTSESPDVTEKFGQLEQLYRDGIRLAENPNTMDFRNEWLQAAQALGRRLTLWRLLLEPNRSMISGEVYSPAELRPVLSEVSKLLDTAENGIDWHNYLLLDRLAATTSEGVDSTSLKRSKLAQEILSRMADPELTDKQREFLASASFVRLYQELRLWAAAKVNLETLAALVERYESSREMRFALAIAQLRERLKWSGDPELQALSARLDQDYRGANMRIAMSDDLLNRMLPKQEPIVTPVSERIAGATVRGRARTTTQLRVRLVPDESAWHFGFEAFGKVYSDTKSDTWPARIRNAAKMHYQARKEISIDDQGLHVAPAQVKAQGRNELVGVDSQLDPVPLVGRLLRDLARQKHKKSRPAANSKAKSKVIRSVKQRMNDTTDKKLAALEKKFQDNVLTSIEQLALLAEPLDMHTTDQRAVMQLRLANTSQLAAHTLRPLAPSDSVLSLQMHETALNNAMMGLGLDGRRMTMLELFEFFAQRFGEFDAVPPDDMPQKAIIEFTRRDAARVRCEADRLELVLSVKELAHRHDKIKDFEIHIHFRPILSGLDVRLVRDGTLQFSGRRLKTGPRVVLHSVIGKMLQHDQEITILSDRLLSDPRLKGLMVTQLVIEDGWIGLALGPAYPRRTAWRAPTPEVLSTPFVR